MAKIKGRSLDSWEGFKRLDEQNRQLWGQRWKERTGSDTLRGWNNSPEYESYLSSKENRLDIYAERNPESYYENLDKQKAEGRPRLDKKTGLPPINITEFYTDFEGYGAITEMILDLDYVRGLASGRAVPVEVLLNYKDETATMGSKVVFGYENVRAFLISARNVWIRELKAIEEAGLDSWIIVLDGSLNAKQTKRRITIFLNLTATSQ